MLVRQAMLLFNIGLFAVVLAFDILVPVYSSYIFYGLLAWIVASLFLYRLPVMNRPIGGTGATRPSFRPGSAPVSGPPLASGTDVGFCIHCGTLVAPGTAVCPACGRPTSS